MDLTEYTNINGDDDDDDLTVSEESPPPTTPSKESYRAFGLLRAPRIRDPTKPIPEIVDLVSDEDEVQEIPQIKVPPAPRRRTQEEEDEDDAIPEWKKRLTLRPNPAHAQRFPSPEDLTEVLIKFVPLTWTEDKTRSVLQDYGTIIRFHFRAGRGVAVAQFERAEEAEDAVCALHQWKEEGAKGLPLWAVARVPKVSVKEEDVEMDVAAMML